MGKFSVAIDSMYIGTFQRRYKCENLGKLR